jgi:hypothetical protein
MRELHTILQVIIIITIIIIYLFFHNNTSSWKIASSTPDEATGIFLSIDLILPAAVRP